MKYRQPPRYDLTGSVSVYVGDRRYYAYLDSELVVQEVLVAHGKVVLRAVTSERIKTSALLRASDQVHASP